jgi:hypothetical protein
MGIDRDGTIRFSEIMLKFLWSGKRHKSLIRDGSFSNMNLNISRVDTNVRIVLIRENRTFVRSLIDGPVYGEF